MRAHRTERLISLAHEFIHYWTAGPTPEVRTKSHCWPITGYCGLCEGGGQFSAGGSIDSPSPAYC